MKADHTLMDGELSLMLALTRRLPKVRFAHRIANVLKKVYLRKKRPTVICDALNSKMYVNPHECVDGWVLFYPHLYDYVEIEYIRSQLKPNGVFVDVGANIGFYSQTISRMVPNGRVIAIEADPFNFEKLVRNLKLNGTVNCTALNVGVSDRSETLSLGINDGGNRGGNSFLTTDSRQQVSVNCRPLYELLSEHGVTNISGAKFDIEGFEFRVLKQFFLDAPAAMHPEFIIIEHHPSLNERAGGDSVELLKVYGYRVQKRHDANFIMTKSV